MNEKKTPPSKQSIRKKKALESDRVDILDAASKLFASNGVEQTSMSDIADQSGFSVGKIYKFFPSKKSLFLHIVGAFLEHLHKSSLQANDKSLPPLQRLENVLQAAIDVANSDPDRILIHLRESPSLFADLKIHYQDIYVTTNRELLTEAMESGHLKSHDPQLLAIMLVGAVDALISHLASSGVEKPFSLIPQLVFDGLIVPLKTD
jgi:AcrR family transcriptional regulator